MKNRLSQLTCLFAAILLVGSACEKVENKVFFESGTAPKLTASTNAVALSPTTESNTALVLDWTNPNYQFTTGVSSHDVSYKLEMDVAGSKFASPNRYSVTIAKDLKKSFTVLELNSILGNTMSLDLGKTYTLETRITSTLVNSSVPLASNVISFTATPYAPPPKVEVPAEGTLWATGDAFASGWSNPLPTPYDNSQKFTQVSNTLYEMVVDFKGGGNYKLIQKQGDWGSQYHMLTGGSAEGGSFEKRDADPAFPGPATAGKYKVTVNFQTGKFTVVKQ